MAFPTTVNLSTLNGSNGFSLTALGGGANLIGTEGMWYGPFVASAGDINGDGFDEMLIGVPYEGGVGYGAAYVVFGKASGFTSSVDPSTLGGSAGFRMHGGGFLVGDRVASAGDINGDGFDDIIVASTRGFPGVPSSTYVVYGKATGFAADLDLSTLDGSDGFSIDNLMRAIYPTGFAVASAGDLNRDGFDDLIVGSPGSAESFVLFGKASGFGAHVDAATLNGSDGFAVQLPTAQLHMTAASACDVNGDGFDDIVIGGTTGSAKYSHDSSYVVFGKATGFNATIDVSALDGSDGFELRPATLVYPVLYSAPAVAAGAFSVSSAGDINGDGFADMIVGMGVNDRTSVVFGKATGWAATVVLENLNGSDGFSLIGPSGSWAGVSVSAAGDVNGDGFDDLIVGAYRADPGGATDAGASYVVFGKATGWGPTLDLSTLPASAGSTLSGAAGALSGYTVASADLNGDGAGDLLIGDAAAGVSHVVFGTPAAGDGTFGALGTAGLDVLKGRQGDDDLAGRGGNDRLYGYAGDDVLSGGGGDDVLSGGAGNDQLLGGTGIDTADYAAALSGVTASLLTGQANGASTGHDTLVSIETLTGSSFDDSLTGDGGANVLRGGAGKDRLDGGAGNDRLYGGAGNDTYYVDSSGDQVFEAAGGGADVVYASASWSMAGQEIENLTVIGAGGVTIGGNGLNNRLTGGSGGDTLSGSAGNDRIDGGSGADALYGGTGSDTFYVDDAGDQVFEDNGQGSDTVYASVDWDLGAASEVENLRAYGAGATAGIVLTGSDTRNAITGGSGVDTLMGRAGNDRLDGGLGADTLVGGTGSDIFYVDDAGDQVVEYGGEGIDTVYASVSWTMTGAAEIERLRASGAGATGGLSLTGNAFANQLFGGSGDDVLDGAGGFDKLIGGGGHDSFVFDSALGIGNRDTIVDFSVADDRIVLNHAVFAGLTVGALAATAFDVDTATQAGPEIVYDHLTGSLYFDGNGSTAGGLIKFATVTGAPTLDHTSFQVV